MSQRSSTLYNLINNPYIYKSIQKIMSGTSLRKKIIKANIKKKNSNVLDIGCGPAEIIEHIPNCNYYGYDIDKRSIAYAKKNTRVKTTTFFVKNLKIKKLKNYQNLTL